MVNQFLQTQTHWNQHGFLGLHLSLIRPKTQWFPVCVCVFVCVWVCVCVCVCAWILPYGCCLPWPSLSFWAKISKASSHTFISIIDQYPRITVKFIMQRMVQEYQSTKYQSCNTTRLPYRTRLANPCNWMKQFVWHLYTTQSNQM